LGRTRHDETTFDDELSFEEARQIFEGPTDAKLREYLPYLNASMEEGDIDTGYRMAHYLSQIGYESGGLRWMEEMADDSQYEDRLDLGNTNPGDGSRYKGRGPFQLTGRDDYRRVGQALGIDLESNPERARDPDVAFRIAGWYWIDRGINRFADLGDAGVESVTFAINGGYFGLADRRVRYFEAKRVLDVYGAQGGPIECNLAAVGVKDARIAHEAAAELNKLGVDATVTVGVANVGALAATLHDEALGTRQMLVVGKPCYDALADTEKGDLRTFISDPPARLGEQDSDYFNCVGRSRESTVRLAAAALRLYRAGADMGLMARFDLDPFNTTPAAWAGERLPVDQ
jgi:predicted chitinase